MRVTHFKLTQISLGEDLTTASILFSLKEYFVTDFSFSGLGK